MRHRILIPLSLLVLLAAAVVPGPSSAQEASRLTRWEVRQVELEAKVSFNEAGDSYADLAMIHQATEGHGATALERVEWLERHSRCVSRRRFTQEEAERRPGNCRWTRNLQPSGAEPVGWDRALHGRWSWYRSDWLTHVRKAHDLVTGRDEYRPCRETPQTWDGVRYGRACVERGEDCPYERRAGLDRRGSSRRILECDVPYVRHAREEGLHNFAVRYDRSREAPSS